MCAGLKEADFSSRVAEGLALRSHGNPEDVKQGANSCPEGTLGRTKTVEASGKDERGTRLYEPLLIQSDEKGFFFAERGVRDDGDAQAPQDGAIPGGGRAVPLGDRMRCAPSTTDDSPT